MRWISLVAVTLLASTASSAPPPAVIISEAPFIAEGVATDRGGQALVSGVVGRTIVRVDRGRARAWLRAGHLAPVGALFGMAADPRRNRLWVAEAFGNGLPGQSGPSRTGLLEVELSSGRVLARHPAAKDGHKRTIGDVALAADGRVYASDSSSGGVYRLDPLSGALALQAQTQLRSPQGMVPTAGGLALIIADYATGLHRLDLATGRTEPLGGEGARLRGLAGLARSGRTLIATQNGGSPNRVLRLRLSSDERAVEAVEILAQGPPGIDDLSLGAVIGRRFVFVGHSQWSAVGPDGSVSPAPAAATLSSLDLE